MADWVGINSTHYDSSCGDDGAGLTVEAALNGTSRWSHVTDENHWFIIDLGESYHITKVRGRSWTSADPIDVDIFISDDKGDFGVAVATGVSTWASCSDRAWVEVDTTDKSGRYVKVEIVDTENASRQLVFGQIAPFSIFDVYGTPLNLTVEPDTLALTITLETPTVFDAVIITPDALALTLTLESTVTFRLDHTITPSTLAIVVALKESIQGPTIQTITPSTLAVVSALLTSVPASGFPTMTPAMHAIIVDRYDGGAWLWLVKISIPGYEDLNYARNTADVIYCGVTYSKHNFDVGLTALNSDGSIPRVMLRVSKDMAFTLETRLNATEGGYGGTIKIIRTHEDFLTTFITELEQVVEILTSESDEKDITITCGPPSPLLRKIPLRRYSSKLCPFALPGLFRGPECQYTGVYNTCTGSLTDCVTRGNQVHWGGEIGLDPNVTII